MNGAPRSHGSAARGCARAFVVARVVYKSSEASSCVMREEGSAREVITQVTNEKEQNRKFVKKYSFLL